MKKIYLSFCLIALCISAFAQYRDARSNNSMYSKHQAQIEKYLFSSKSMSYYLMARMSDDHYECRSFFYDDKGRVIAVKDSIGSEILAIDSVVYDANNNVIRLNGYQSINGVWKHVYFVNYAYDSDGNRVQRTNFNSFGSGTFEQGGVYDYTYVQGKLTYYEAYFGNYEDLFETCEFTYDEQGRLQEEVLEQGFDNLELAAKNTYEYNAMGLLSRKTSYFYEYGWSESGYDLFLYDNAGNCIEHSRYDDYGEIMDKKEYEYDLTIPSSSVSMPYYVPELTFPEAYNDANMRVVEHWYGLDADMVFQYICDFRYIYDERPSGVEAHSTASSVQVYPNPASDEVHVDLAVAATSAVLYDLQGRICKVLTLQKGNNTIPTADLEDGIYFLKMNLEDATSGCSKIVVKR